MSKVGNYGLIILTSVERRALELHEVCKSMFLAFSMGSGKC